jgi:hypothetical protein
MAAACARTSGSSLLSCATTEEMALRPSSARETGACAAQVAAQSSSVNGVNTGLME